jgi:hypothetical protein
MGRRAGRRRPTRKEKIAKSKEKRGKSAGAFLKGWAQFIAPESLDSPIKSENDGFRQVKKSNE